ncbi:dehydrogenase [Candidatus Omnitrophus magneticus]|uniref:Dehydrogenase n=1 Tax=Candidatus Omnitrophus magneticus TaxID=1609969 RepID=A0A0F0CRW4_9BACT|nr:dehydrogenase [Candidatus Omnitrophus magneticus]
MGKNNKLKVAIIGCGRIASLFSKDPLRQGIVTHAAAYKDNKDIELIAACDIDKNRLEDFGKTWGVKALYTDYNELFQKEKLDIVSICTWEGTHYDIARTAISEGVKAIFCEKPITDNLAKADELVRLSRKEKVIFAVNHSRRWDKLEWKIKNIIESKKLGEIQSVSAYYTAGISNTGTHLIDLLRFILGEAEWVWANPKIKNQANDPTIDGFIYFKNGFSCALHGLNVKSYVIFEIDIYGTKGRLRIQNSGFGATMWKVIKSPRFSGYYELGTESVDLGDGYQDVLKNAVKDIVECVKEKRETLSTALDGTRTLEIITALHESLRAGGLRINLPLLDRDVTIKK